MTICGQSYKASTIVIYNSRVVPDLKIPHYDSRLVNYKRKLFIRLPTGRTDCQSHEIVDFVLKNCI